MADIISRLKLESGEFDSKIKRAGQELLAYSEHCRKTGLQMGFANQDAMDFAKALGNMETTSRTARGQVNELSEAFVNLRVMYNQMTDEEKNNQFGKNLAASLETLKQRVQDAKTQLDTATQSLNDNGEAGKGTSGILEMLKDKFTVNFDALTLFNKGLQAGKAALDVAKDAFFASESNVDEWGRTVQAAQGLYVGFLNAINNGDISGYLDHMGQIVQAAREAYNELDTLGTMKTIQAPQKSRQQTENERIRSMIQTGRYIAPMDGRRNAVFRGKEMQNGQLLTPGQIRMLERQLQNGMRTTVTLVEREVKQTGRAIDAYYNSIAKQNGMSLKEFRKGVSSWDEFSKKMQGYENYKRWDSEARTKFARQGGRGSVDFDKSNPYAEFRKWGNFRVDKMGENSYNDLTQLIQQRDQQMAMAYGMQTQAYRTMNRAEGVTVSKLMKGESTGGGKGGKTTPQERAAERVSEAERTYAETLQKNSIRLDAGLDSTLDNKKKELSAQERLFDAYNDAYATYKDPAYKEASKQAAEKIKQLAEEVKTLTDTYEASKQAARELESSQKKLADAQYATAVAIGNNDLKSYYAAQKKVAAEGGPADSTTAFSYTQNNLDAFIGNLKERISQSEVGSSLFNALTSQLADAQTIKSILETSFANGIDMAQFDLSGMWEKVFDGQNIDDKVWQNLINTINEKLQAEGKPTIEIDFKTGNIKKVADDAKNMSKEWQAAGSAIQAVGSAMSQIEDPAAKVIGTIAQAIATIALTFAKSLEKTFGPWDWIAAAAAGTATMISTISAIHSATGYANGGVVDGRGGGFVGGTAFSGDNIGNVRLDAGEVVLNRAQQGVLASELQGNPMRNMTLSTVVRGEDIRFVLNTNGRRTGRGEYVQSKSH